MSQSFTCKNCDNTYTDPAAMVQRKGKPISLCWDCRKESLRAAKARKSGGSVTTKTLASVVAKVTGTEPRPVKLNGHLEVTRGYGFRASLEDGVFVIEQDTNEGETATMVFNADELRRLTEWVNSTPREI